MAENAGTSNGEMASSGAVGRPGKYLTFALEGDRYALHWARVQEIIGIMPLTRVPGAPEFVRGRMTLRGQAIPVVDVPRKLNLPAREDSGNACVIIATFGEGPERITAGLAIDAPTEVLDLAEDQIHILPLPASETNGGVMPPGTCGEPGERYLDLESVFSPGDTRLLRAMGKPAAL